MSFIRLYDLDSTFGLLFFFISSGKKVGKKRAERKFFYVFYVPPSRNAALPTDHCFRIVDRCF